MALYQSLEDLLFAQTRKLQDLETATELIQGKSCVKEELVNVQLQIGTIANDIQILKQDVELMKLDAERCKDLSSTLKSLNYQIQHMTKNIPPKLMEYINSELPTEKCTNNNLNNHIVNNEDHTNSNTTISNTVANGIKSCKKTLFVEPDIPLINPISQNEFAKIPKYIIGRYSLETLNNLVSSLNHIIKNKYSLIALGKNGAKKKGELDLFLHFSKEVISLGADERNTYFFTPDDYERYIKSKLDKTKLNLIIALRHCKRLREIRTAKAVHYALIL